MGLETRVLTASNADELAEWCEGQKVIEHDALDRNKTSPGINLLCGSEVKRASVGDTIIRRNDGTFAIF
jgi:hypothetical protein